MEYLKGLSLERITHVTGGRYAGPEENKEKMITGVTADSRNVRPGSLFIPIKGERVDGHDYIEEVMEKGALCTFTEHDMGNQPYSCIVVKSAIEAMQKLAAYYRQILGIPVIGITGSVGKTSTKEMIASVLRVRYRVRKTEGNLNNEIGLPLTIFGIKEEDEIAVLEMGISDFGEMRVLTQMANPDTAVITNIGYSHLEFLHDRDGILKAKSEIFENLKPGGNIVLNGDDDKLCTIKSVKGIKPVTFGLSESSDIYADHIRSLGFSGSEAMIHTPLGNIPVSIPMPGEHMVYNACAAACIGLIYGLSLSEIKRGIEGAKTITGRFHIIDNNGVTIIDDCYNANPVSMKASIKLLSEAKGRKVAVLGDMGELGDEKLKLHGEVGRYLGALSIDVLYTCGTLSKEIEREAKAKRPSLITEHFSDLDTMENALAGRIKSGDTVLVKASHFMDFKRLVLRLKGSD